MISLYWRLGGSSGVTYSRIIGKSPLKAVQTQIIVYKRIQLPYWDMKRMLCRNESYDYERRFRAFL
jgi:hypothetical protein